MDVGPGQHDVVGVRLVDEIESNFCKLMCIEDTQEAHTSDNSDEEGSEVFELSGTELAKDHAEKCPDNMQGKEDDGTNTAMQLLISDGPVQPSVLPVSAMKGSREKAGASSRKLTVSWAPDVYDPVPNSLSHTVKSKQKKSRKNRDKENNNKYKRSGKKGQKSNSRGGGGKEKKQVQKVGKTDKGYRPLSNCASGFFDEFDVSGPDHCGSSFLKKSSTEFHYSVAEAL